MIYSRITTLVYDFNHHKQLIKNKQQKKQFLDHIQKIKLWGFVLIESLDGSTDI